MNNTNSDKELKSGLKNQSIQALLIIIFYLVLFLGCSATKTGLSANQASGGKKNYERIVYNNKGKPILKIECKYIGKKPVEGFKTYVQWEIIDTDFYNLSFINLSHKRIKFLSSKVYQSFPLEIPEEGILPARQSSIFIEHKDYRKVHDPKFDPLEYKAERTHINWPIHTNNLYAYMITNIIFQIKYMEQDYRFNIFMVYEK